MTIQYDTQAEQAFPLLGELGAALREFDAAVEQPAEPIVPVAAQVAATKVCMRILAAESGSVFDPSVFRRLMAAMYFAGAYPHLRHVVTADSVKAMEDRP